LGEGKWEDLLMSQVKLQQMAPIKTCRVILDGKTGDPIDLWVDPASKLVKTMRQGVYNVDIEKLLAKPNIHVVAQYT